MPLILESYDDGPRFVLNDVWTDADTNTYRESDVRFLEVNSSKGFTGASLDFLSEIPDLERLDVIALALRDVSGIKHVPGLLSLKLSTYDEMPIDFGSFGRLERLYLEWRPGAESVFETSTLRRLYLNHYPRQADLRSIVRLTSLEHLEIGNSRTIRGLGGIESLRSLQVLGVYGLAVESLEGLEALPLLRRLAVDSCRMISDIGPLSGMRGLCSLRLSNCGDIKSLAPIAHLAGLEVLIFDESTRILDDNLSVLLDLPALRQIAFRNRRTYSHTCEELEERIRIRDIT